MVLKNSLYSRAKYQITFKYKLPDRGNKALRDGIESYDRRHGWRGPITNKNNDMNWEKKLKELSIDPTLNWEIGEISEINESFFFNSKDQTKIKISKLIVQN